MGAWDDFANLLFGSGNDVMDWGVDELRKVLEPLLDRIINISSASWISLQNVVEPGLTSLWNIGQDHYNWLTWTVNYKFGQVASQVGGIGAQLTAGFAQVITDSQQILNSSATWLDTQVKNHTDGILTRIGTSEFWIDSTLQGFFGPLTPLVQGGFDLLGQQLDNKADDIEKFFMSSVSDILEGLVTPIFEGGKLALTHVMAQVSGDVKDITDFIDTLPITELLAAGESLGGTLLAPVGGILSKQLDALFPKTPTKPGDSQKVVKQAMATLMGATLAFGGAVALGELVHPVKEAGFKYVSAMLFDMAGFGSLGTAITMSFAEHAFIKPLRYALAAQYQPEIPGPQDLINFLVREQLTPTEFTNTMLFHGFSKYWSDKYWGSHWVLPQLTLSRELLYRGEINEAEYKALLTLNDFHPAWRDRVANVVWKLPGSGDIIRFAVREVFSREAAKSPDFAEGIPPAFEENMKLLGFQPEWAKRYWDAHFELIPQGRLFELHYRGELTLEELSDELVKHDIRPSDIELMLKATYRQIPIIYLRRAWELGELSDADLETELLKHGYDPGIVSQLAAITKRMALENEVSEVRRAYISEFEEGWISPIELKGQINGLGYKKEVVEFYMRKAQIQKQRKLLKQYKTIAIQAFRKGTLNEDQFREELNNVGLQTEFVEATVKLEKIRKEREVEEVILG